MFEAAPSFKHRLMLKLTYGGGLRRSEVINLKICDVDFKNNHCASKVAKVARTVTRSYQGAWCPN
ncbi:MAG: tyrosine-type recombinase/integrase [Breznakibacter sp.]|nr:tyrosine-type recombinase/integrase [Breznakibacter sp.]